MIIYNTTTTVSWNIHDAWLEWMKGEHIPLIMNTGYFSHWQILKILDLGEESPTYAVQFFAEKIEDYHIYRDKHAAGFRRKALERWGSQMISFHTLMEVIN